MRQPLSTQRGLRHFWHELLATGLVVLIAACGPGRDELQAGSPALLDVLGGEATGFAQALEPREFLFPRDHGPHPDYRNEWWYVTGNLAAADGREFGYQLTFFRTSLAAEALPRSSAWATRQAYMAHFALGDLAAGMFRAADRFSRSALELAGARARPFRVWIDDWSMESVEPADEAPSGSAQAVLPLRVRAGAEEVQIDLILGAAKPVVLHGKRGLSRKGSRPGSASYYYSFTRIDTSGTVTVGGIRTAVEGHSWLDREWSTSALEPQQIGWDWFALQLDDGSELMLYVMRRADGGADGASSGTLVAPDGSSEYLPTEAFSVQVLERWVSPHSGARYPARWRIEVPSARILLTVQPRLADQEIELAFRYWEGSVEVAGVHGDTRVQGLGFVELTGY